MTTVRSNRAYVTHHWAVIRQQFIIILLTVVILAEGVSLWGSMKGDQPRDQYRVPAALMQVGAYVCVTFDGLKDVKPIPDKRYRFTCRDSSVVEVEVTVR